MNIKRIAIVTVIVCIGFILYKPTIHKHENLKTKSCCCDTIKQCNEISCTIEKPKSTFKDYSNSVYIDAINCFCHNKHTSIAFLKNTLFFNPPIRLLIPPLTNNTYKNINIMLTTISIPIRKKPPKSLIG